MKEVSFDHHTKPWLFNTKGEGGGQVVILSREPLVVQVRIERPLHWSEKSPEYWTGVLQTLDAVKDCFPEITEWETLHFPNLSDAPGREWNIVFTPSRIQRNLKVTRLLLPE